ncbi:hypothetical protein [uncultured Methanomethylovorans sp.]|nr:hypothetical protein [uncultured Methanomethylovorans sp.]
MQRTLSKVAFSFIGRQENLRYVTMGMREKTLPKGCITMLAWFMWVK